MTTIQAALSSTLASFGLLALLVLIGYPTAAIVARVGRVGPPTLGLSWLFGLFWLSAISWRAFQAGIRLNLAYRGLLTVALVLAVLALWSGRRSGRRGGAAAWRGAGPDAAGFLACAGAYALLVFSKLGPDDLAWPTILNADIFVYLKAAAYLALFPGGTPTVGGMDLHGLAAHDVFGTFGVLAFTKFALHVGLAQLPVPVMGLAVGLVGMAVARCCRILFRLGLPLSVLTALVTVTGPLFQYVVLNYFLSQVLFVAVLVTASLWLAELRHGPWRAGAGAAAAVAASAGCTLLCYDVWALQFVAVAGALVAGLRIASGGEALRRRVPAGAAAGVAAAALAVGAMALAGTSRLGDVLDKLATMSVPNSSGWPLPFVDLGLLLGLPVDWQAQEGATAGIGGPVLRSILLLAVVGIAAVRLDRGDGAPRRRAVLALFCVAAACYLAVWACYGDAYQQWKFASTLPLGFGFAVPATVAHLVRLGSGGWRSAAAGAGTAAFLLACAALDVSHARDDLMGTLARIPATMASLGAVDRRPGAEPVYVDIDDFHARMAALVFVNHKPLSFRGHSQFGEGQPPPTDSPHLAVRAACDPGGEARAVYGAETVRPGQLPAVSPGTLIRFTGDVTACLSLEGFGEPVAVGQRSRGRRAAIRFDCACDLGTGEVAVVLRVAGTVLPDLPGPQTVAIAVNGSPPRSFTLDAGAFRDVVVPVPRGAAAVDLEFDMPGETPRPGADAATGAVYAMTVESLEVR